jgi:carbon-monoxide dehydrogenase medium subunit
MFPASFEYHRAASFKEALALLKRYGDDAKLLAGGHSLIPMMKLRLVQPQHVVDIARLTELRQIREQRGKIIVGAASTHGEVASSEIVKGKLGLLAQCAAAIGDVQVRNRGTIGGSLSHSDPAADYPAAVLALEGDITLESEAGTRTIKAEDFFVDLMTTAAKGGEILTQVSFAPIPVNSGFAYLKHRQPASGFAIVGVAVLVTLGRRGNCERVRVGITGLGPKAFRARSTESVLVGKKADDEAITAAASHTADGADALSDIHAAADFRAELSRVYTRRALASAIASAKP